MILRFFLKPTVINKAQFSKDINTVTSITTQEFKKVVIIMDEVEINYLWT